MAETQSTAGKLQNKVAVITGASSGIGFATALALVTEGCRLLAVGRSEEKLARLRAENPEQIQTLSADVSDPASAELIVATALGRFGALDIVLPNAGIYAGGDLVGTPIKTIADVVATNITGVFSLVRAALPHLIEQGRGDIVVTSSVAGHQDIHWEPVYSATKHAVQSFVHTVRRQSAATGVRIGAIAPGVVLNPLWGFEPDSPEEQQRIDEGTGIRSSDVADAIVFMLTRPQHVVVRDLVLLPTGQEI